MPPEILQRLFYPRRQRRSPCPPGAQDVQLEVAPGVSLGGRFHGCAQTSPTLLFFHGNGEIAQDKKLLVLPRAEHNTVFLRGLQDYLAAAATGGD